MLAKVRPRGLKIVQELITKGRPTISLAMVAVKLDTGVESALLLSPQKVFMIVVPVEMEEMDDLVEVVMEKVTAKVCTAMWFIRNVVKICTVWTFHFCIVVSYFQ